MMLGFCHSCVCRNLGFSLYNSQTLFSVLFVEKVPKLLGEEKLAPPSLCSAVLLISSPLENSSHILFLAEEFLDKFPPPSPGKLLSSFRDITIFSIITSSSCFMLSIHLIRLWMMMICHHLSSSVSIDFCMTFSFHLLTIVSIGFFFLGGVARMEIFLSPERARLSDRGIGVAESDRISTQAFIFLNFSFCETPNLCSSSITRSPSFL